MLRGLPELWEEKEVRDNWEGWFLMEWKYWRKILGGICMILFSIVLLLESLVFFEWWSGEIALLAGVISLVGFVKVYWNIPSEEEEAKRKKQEGSQTE